MKKTKKINDEVKTLGDLTIENAPNVSTIINKLHPEWGTKSFTYVPDDFSYHGRGSDSAMLFEHEYKFWSVVSFKQEPVNNPIQEELVITPKAVGEPFDFNVLFEATPEVRLPDPNEKLKEETQIKDAYAKKIGATGDDWKDAFRRRINTVVKTINEFIIYSNKGDSENAMQSHRYAIEEIAMVAELGFEAVKQAENIQWLFEVIFQMSQAGEVSNEYKLNATQFIADSEPNKKTRKFYTSDSPEIKQLKGKKVKFYFLGDPSPKVEIIDEVTISDPKFDIRVVNVYTDKERMTQNFFEISDLQKFIDGEEVTITHAQEPYIIQLDESEYKSEPEKKLKGGTIKSISDETPILPSIVAQNSAEHVTRELYKDEFKNWDSLTMPEKDALNKKYSTKVEEIENYLVARAESLYKHNESFRKEIKSAKGLSKLYMYMNHWSGISGDKIVSPIDTIMAKWYKDKAVYEAK